MTLVRFPFKTELFDTDQDQHSLKVIEVDKKFMLEIRLGIKATKVQEIEEPSDEVKDNNRDATVGKDILIDIGAKISLEMIPATPPDGREKTANFLLVLKAHSGTKIPGTGDGYLLV